MNRRNAEERWLATLRPSRVRVVQGGSPAWADVELIDIESGQAVLAAALEAFGLRVRRTAVGQARHLVAALSDVPVADFVVLQCHGDDGEILPPELCRGGRALPALPRSHHTRRSACVRAIRRQRLSAHDDELAMWRLYR